MAVAIKYRHSMGFFGDLAILLGVKKRQAHILIVGLDNSGKSTVINHFKSESSRPDQIVPTIGFNVEKIKSNSFNSCKFIEF